MCRKEMRQLLFPLALWLSALGPTGTRGDELSVPQQRGLQVALEKFHNHPPVQWAFKEIGVDTASDTSFPGGTFVRLEFGLQQTSCRKKDWRNTECKVKPNGRKRNCLACIKFDSKDRILKQMIHCPIGPPWSQRDPEGQQETQCTQVERAGEEPHSYYFPGTYAFSRSHSSG
ncbi:retinoic acid receptor responder protein 2 [Gracilinanus agilis]|uniref:retinoic acid receptor responder protein 2 n=1 Tax=Gracilinanus agilis TaxID=191870 RepID=UPI001CFE10CD|nr:retinoic acid receptor responder protein 2 [Gracilinanus agilis]